MLTIEILDQVAREARAAAPRECCGVLIGAGGRIELAVPVANVAAVEGRFEAQGLDLAAVERAARAGGRQVVGYYHSHPAGRPMPSRLDVTGSLWGAVGSNFHLIMSSSGAWGLFWVRAGGWMCVARGKNEERAKSEEAGLRVRGLGI